MEEKHTPGPWEAVDKRPQCAGFSIFHESQFVAFVGDNDHLTPAAANARLIAAAPELLEALTRLSAQCERLRLPEQRQTDAEANALAVIAKATQ